MEDDEKERLKKELDMIKEEKYQLQAQVLELLDKVDGLEREEDLQFSKEFNQNVNMDVH